MTDLAQPVADHMTSTLLAFVDDEVTVDTVVELKAGIENAAGARGWTVAPRRHIDIGLEIDGEPVGWLMSGEVDRSSSGRADRSLGGAPGSSSLDTTSPAHMARAGRSPGYDVYTGYTRRRVLDLAGRCGAAPTRLAVRRRSWAQDRPGGRSASLNGSLRLDAADAPVSMASYRRKAPIGPGSEASSVTGPIPLASLHRRIRQRPRPVTRAYRLSGGRLYTVYTRATRGR